MEFRRVLAERRWPVVAVDDARAIAAPRQLDRRGEAGRPGADDEDAGTLAHGATPGLSGGFKNVGQRSSLQDFASAIRSAQHRVGNEGVSNGGCRWWPSNAKKNNKQ